MNGEIDDVGDLLVTIHLPTGDNLMISTPPSRFLFQMDREAYIEAWNAAKSAPGAEPESIV
jgi:hypothetical protein